MKNPPTGLAIRPQAGVTMTELMVALTVSLILLAGVVQIYLSNKATYNLMEGQSRIQESARFALEMVARTIRMTGYTGCGNSNLQTGDLLPINSRVDAPPAHLTYDPNTVVQGIENSAGGTVTFGGVTLSDVIPSSDIITVRGASATSAKLTNNLGTAASAIQVDSNSENWKDGDVLFITDCAVADLFRATGVTNGATTTIAHASLANYNNGADLTKAYNSSSFVLGYQSSTYFVADTGRTNQSGDPITALYYVPYHHTTPTAVELIEGVEDMQIFYGVNSDKAMPITADTYVTAAAINTAAAAGTYGWRDVVSVRIAMLINSVNNVTTASQPITFEGTALAPTDRRLRRSFTTTISLRNRVQ